MLGSEPILAAVALLLLGPTTSPKNALGSRKETIVAGLEPLSSAACNAHLALFLIDAILLTVFPELGVAVPGSGFRLEEAGSAYSSHRVSLDDDRESDPLTPPGSRPP